MDNIEILDMTLEDLKEIEPIFSTHFDDFWTTEILKKELEKCNKNCDVVVFVTSEGKTYDFSSKGASSNYRYGQNEPLGSLQSTAERGWFNNRFLEFRSESQLPVDQYMLASLVADPDRYLFMCIRRLGKCSVNVALL